MDMPQEQGEQNAVSQTSEPGQNKKIIFGAVIALVLITLTAILYFLIQPTKETGLRQPSQEPAVPLEEKTAEEKAASGALPAINPVSNPLESSPDVNPVNQTNPFRNIKTNPF